MTLVSVASAEIGAPKPFPLLRSCHPERGQAIFMVIFFPI